MPGIQNWVHVFILNFINWLRKKLGNSLKIAKGNGLGTGLGSTLGGDSVPALTNSNRVVPGKNN